MATIALKIDVDTYRGTREGVPRLAAALERAGARATFLFSLGPDHTGRAIKRVFRRGFLGKVRRTSVTQHYGIKTLLYGVLLPGPHIGRRCAEVMRDRIGEGLQFLVGRLEFAGATSQFPVQSADFFLAMLSRRNVVVCLQDGDGLILAVAP